MAKQCAICGKTPVVGRQHSHANNVSPRRFEPNLQRVRAVINGGTKRIRVCTRCLRSGKVTKAVKQGISSPSAPKAIGPYSPAVRSGAHGEFLFISGQVPIDPASGNLV